MKPPGIVWLCALQIFTAATFLLAAPNEKTRRHAIISRIPRSEVKSSAIATIGYSRKMHALEIEFVNGAIYRYVEVPLDLYRQLVAAESKARFYDHNIRGRYRSLHVRPRRKK